MSHAGRQVPAPKTADDKLTHREIWATNTSQSKLAAETDTNGFGKTHTNNITHWLTEDEEVS